MRRPPVVDGTKYDAKITNSSVVLLFLARWISWGKFEKDVFGPKLVPTVQFSSWYRVRVPLKTVTMVGPG
jgi:hypothetical protein